MTARCWWFCIVCEKTVEVSTEGGSWELDRKPCPHCGYASDDERLADRFRERNIDGVSEDVRCSICNARHINAVSLSTDDGSIYVCNACIKRAASLLGVGR